MFFSVIWNDLMKTVYKITLDQVVRKISNSEDPGHRKRRLSMVLRKLNPTGLIQPSLIQAE